MILRHLSTLPVKAVAVAAVASALAFVLMLHNAAQPSSRVSADPAYGNVKPDPAAGFVIEGHKMTVPVRFTTCTTTTSSLCRLGAYAVKLQYDAAKLGIAETAGLSTGGNTSTTLKDTSKNWKNLEWIGARVTIVGGAGANGTNGNPQSRTVTSNTANTLTVSPPWTVIPNTTSFYELGGMQEGGWLGSTNRTISCPVGPTSGANWVELHCVSFDDLPMGPTGGGNLTTTTFQTTVGNRGLTSVQLLTPDTKVLKIDGFQIPADIVNGARRIVRCPDPDNNNNVNVIDLLLIAQANGAHAINNPALYSPKKDPDENNSVNVIDLQITAAVANKKCVL